MSTNHTLTLRSPEDLTLEAFQEIAWGKRPLALHAELLGQLAECREAMLVALGDRVVYGVNTGMGYLASVRLSAEEMGAHQANLLLGRAVGGPPYLDRAEARAVLLARLAGFLGGQAGVSAALCNFLVDRLNDGFTPAIPRTGIGCAGEIIPLAHAFGPFIGVGYVLAEDDTIVDARTALAERGVEPMCLGVKEGIALLAGAPGTLALAVGGWGSARMLYRQAVVTFAMAIDALQAPLGPYDPVVARLANDEAMGAVLHSLGKLLSGSGTDRGVVQAPVSFRVIPQVLTELARVLARTEADLRRHMTAATDSPAFVDGRFISTGNFHALGLAADLDHLCIALAQMAELAGQHIHRLLDSRFSGLPDQLTPYPGPQAGLVVVHKRAVGVLNEMHRLVAPATVGLVDTSMGQEDAMTFSFETAEKLRRCVELARDVLACELLTCRQAWALRGGDVAAGIQEHAASLSAAVEPVMVDRPLGEDITRLVRRLAGGEFQT